SDFSCGENTAWLGNGVSFHELNMAGAPNDVGLSIVSFTSAGGDALKLIVTRDGLRGVRLSDNVVFAGNNPHRPVIRLRKAPSSPKQERPIYYRLKIVQYGKTDFWVEPAGAMSPIYSFTYQQEGAKDQKEAPLCGPTTDPDWGALQGWATIFTGDRY